MIPNQRFWQIASIILGGTFGPTKSANTFFAGPNSGGPGIPAFRSLVVADLPLPASTLVVGIEFVIDGGGAVLSTGIKGYLEVPFNCTINRATLLADQSGSVVVDIFKVNFATFAPPTHPASGDKITSSTPPTISSATKSQDSTLSGWTTTINAGDILAFNVNSATTITRVTCSLMATKT